MRRYPPSILTSLAAALLLLLALAEHTQAQPVTFTVTTIQDAPHTTPVHGNCTSTLAGNPCTLRAAIQATTDPGVEK